MKFPLIVTLIVLSFSSSLYGMDHHKDLIKLSPIELKNLLGISSYFVEKYSTTSENDDVIMSFKYKQDQRKNLIICTKTFKDEEGNVKKERISSSWFFAMQSEWAKIKNPTN